MVDENIIPNSWNDYKSDPIYVPNKRIACTPLGKFRSVQTSGSGFKYALHKTALLELTVVHGNDNYSVGDLVYIRGDALTLGWTKEEFSFPETEDVKFILVPEDAVQITVRK